MLLLATPASTFAAFTRHGIGCHTRPRTRSLTHRLLQCCPSGRTESNDGQVATSVERRSSSGQRYNQVWPWLERLLYTELHWLDVPEQVDYKLSVMMFSCIHGQAPQYLIDFCHPASIVASRQKLRSACRRLLVVPRCRLSTTCALCGWSIGVKFFAGLPVWSCFWPRYI